VPVFIVSLITLHANRICFSIGDESPIVCPVVPYFFVIMS
jgi:hypothetical protein